MERAARSSSGLTWLAAAFGAAACALAGEIGADSRWLAAVGAAIVRLGRIPHAIPYATAPSNGWHDAPALGQLCFHALEVALGDRGLLLAQVAAVGVALAALAVDLRRAGARDGAGAAVVLAVVAAVPATFFVVRAQLFSLALFPVLAAILRDDARRPSRRIWLAPPLLALWANLHGGVLVGAALAGTYLVLHRARRAPRSTAALLACVAAALVATPAGLRSVDYYRAVLGGATAATHFGLWAPLSLHSGLDLLTIAIGLPLLVCALRSRPPAWELVALVALAAMSVEAQRDAVWLLLLAAVPAARAFGSAGAGVLSHRTVVLCAFVPVAMLALGAARPVAASGGGQRLLREAARAAHGTPILADPVDAERLAADGTRIWIGNPLEAFRPADQRAYLDWLRGDARGDRVLAHVRVVVTLRGGEPQLRLASDSSFRELDRDAGAVLYGR